MSLIEVDYPTFIRNMRNFYLKSRYLETPKTYILRAWDNVFTIGSEISKTSTWEKNHFENHYKSNFNTELSNVAGSFSTAQTDTVIWNTTSTKRFVLSSYLIAIRNSTLGTQSFQLFDETNSGNNLIVNISLTSGATELLVSKDEFVSSAIGNDLKITFSGNMNVAGSFKAYEVF